MSKAALNKDALIDEMSGCATALATSLESEKVSAFLRDDCERAIGALTAGIAAIAALPDPQPEDAQRDAAIEGLRRERDFWHEGFSELAGGQNAVVSEVWALLGGQDPTRENGQSLVTRVTEVIATRQAAETALGEARKAIVFARNLGDDGAEFLTYWQKGDAAEHYEGWPAFLSSHPGEP